MLELGPRGRVWIALAVLLATVGALATVIAQSDQSNTEVRISARQLEDGRVEFALQQREGDSWGERILPDSRLFPANPTVDRWLSSSGVSIETIAEPEIWGETDEYGTVAQGQIPALSWSHRDVGYRTWVSFQAASTANANLITVLTFDCQHRTGSLSVTASAGAIGVNWGTVPLAEYEWAYSSFGRDQDAEWLTWGRPHSNRVTITGQTAADFFTQAKQERWLFLALPTAPDGGYLYTGFDLTGVLETPVQHLLERCLP